MVLTAILTWAGTQESSPELCAVNEHCLPCGEASGGTTQDGLAVWADANDVLQLARPPDPF